MGRSFLFPRGRGRRCCKSEALFRSLALLFLAASCLVFKRKHCNYFIQHLKTFFSWLYRPSGPSPSPRTVSLAEAMSAESIKQEIMASQEASSAEVLQTPIPASISTTIQTNFAQQNEGITTIATVSLPETMTAAEAIVATESISVGTQVVPDRTLGGQEMEESIPQVQPHESVDGVSGTEESIVISTESVGIAPTNSSEASIQLANLSTVSSNYPWATRLHDCELIGDSYRGYVTNEVELDLILTLHKQHTNSCWGTRQSPSSAKPSIRLMWKSQYVPYDGIPFLNTGERKGLKTEISIRAMLTNSARFHCIKRNVLMTVAKRLVVEAKRQV